MRYETNMTVKGQITVPKDVRDLLGLRPGQKVGIETDPDGTVRIVKAKPVDDRKEWLERLAEVRAEFKLQDEFQGMDGLAYQRWIRGDGPEV
ncbi:MAG: AbrB/MazE/SpoVT family DNA-binding domain-containing protein [Qipengyuania sp.]|jgi:AbrB family looped-hinge helix DNA binding protein|nr:AbrB/MazE/SpoVT family DNA-binding domain-containing protein [Qipengyuania sp.]